MKNILLQSGAILLLAACGGMDPDLAESESAISFERVEKAPLDNFHRKLRCEELPCEDGRYELSVRFEDLGYFQEIRRFKGWVVVSNGRNCPSIPPGVQVSVFGTGPMEQSGGPLPNTQKSMILTRYAFQEGCSEIRLPFHYSTTAAYWYGISDLVVELDTTNQLGSYDMRSNNTDTYRIKDPSGENWRGDLVINDIDWAATYDGRVRFSFSVLNRGMTPLETSNGQCRFQVRGTAFDNAGNQVYQQTSFLSNGFPWFPGLTSRTGFLFPVEAYNWDSIEFELDTLDEVQEADEQNNTALFTWPR